jgi:tetratricopeptide (TPR) repeat protein
VSELQTAGEVQKPERAAGPGAATLLQRGYAALGRADVDTALGLFAQVLVMEPERADLLNDCGGIHGLQGRHEEAVGFFQRALLVQPERADVLNNLGLALGRLARHEEAAGYLGRALELRPDYFDALCNLGYSLSQLERHEQALACLDRALAINGAHPGALCNRAASLAGLGLHGAALEAFRAALRIDAGHLSALSGAAGCLIALKRPDEALVCLAQALQADPLHAGALANQGLALVLQGRDTDGLACLERSLLCAPDPLRALLDQSRALQSLGKPAVALERIERALALAPEQPGTILVRGLILIDIGRCEEALVCFDRVLEIAPANLAALNNRAVALGKLHNPSAALACLDEALQRHPGDVHTLINRGIALDRLVRHEEALASFEQALLLRPDSLEALTNRAATLFNMFRMDETKECLHRILKRSPDDVPALTTLGAVLWHQNCNAEARSHLERALTLSPGHVNAVNDLSFIDLAEGELVRGFRGQEIRWQTELFSTYRFRSTAPLWLGKESLEDRTIFVQHEQGLGDTLQFVRYIRLLAARGAKVILSVQQPLRELLTGVAGAKVVLSDGDGVPDHDLQCPLMSLPLAFATTMHTIPGGVPYIQADPERVAEWQERLGPARRPRIGLVWAGRQFPPINVPRDMSLRLLLPLLALDADFISLQKDVPAPDRELLASLPELAPLGEILEDFADTAALVATLDLVIAVDTAAVHLAAAMGRPTWIMNRHASCWRWLRDGRTDSPWYPTVRLFRQHSLGDWEGVVREVLQAAQDFLARWSPACADGPPPAPSSRGLMRKAAALARQGDFPGAIGSYTQVLAADPEQPAALAALGHLLGQLGCHAAALACFDRALLKAPDSQELLCNRGAALTALGKEEQALPCFDRALELDPANLPARFNRGVALLQQGLRRQALACFDEVLSGDPGHAQARNLRGMIYLSLGSFRDGFGELASCRETQVPVSQAPRWLGDTSLQGRTILLHTEGDDLGGAIQLTRYIPLVAAQADRVLLAFPPQLHRLLRSTFADAKVEVLPQTAELLAHDLHCPVMSLPLVFNTRPETIPPPVRLRVSAALGGAWRTRLGSPAPGRIRVGLAWHPGAGLTPGDLLPLLALPVDFFSLQLDCTEADPPGVRRMEGQVADLADMAALIECLDLVISIDSAVAHLACAAGRPAFILLTRAAAWCWMEDGADSPWYPTASLFRQRAAGDWGGVVRDVQQAAKAFIAGFTACGRAP